MGNYFRQIYTCSHAEWWTTVFDPCRQGKLQSFFCFFFLAALGQLRLEGEMERRGVEGRATGGVKRRLGD